ncbi:hypothetical protein KI387_013372, partial [Taxus chinensis]
MRKVVCYNLPGHPHSRCSRSIRENEESLNSAIPILCYSIKFRNFSPLNSW